MTTIIDGKSVAKTITDRLENEVSAFKKKPHLVVILVGSNPASQIYVRNKQKKAESIGIKSTVLNLPVDVEELFLIEKIKELNIDEDVTGILVQLPLPKHINETNVIETISPLKDVDGFTDVNSGRLLSGATPFAYPCTPKGIMTLLDTYHIELEGKSAVVIGRSNIVGKPVAIMLMQRNATVTLCHSKTKDLKEFTKNADIIVSAVGKKVLTADMVKQDAVVVDVGIFKDENDKLTGDVDFENVKDKVSFITPVPGGVGPMTIAMLMENTVELFKANYIEE